MAFKQLVDTWQCEQHPNNSKNSKFEKKFNKFLKTLMLSKLKFNDLEETSRSLTVLITQ